MDTSEIHDIDYSELILSLKSDREKALVVRTEEEKMKKAERKLKAAENDKRWAKIKLKTKSNEGIEIETESCNSSFTRDFWYIDRVMQGHERSKK